KSAHSFWYEIEGLYNKHNVDFMWDVSDSFTRPFTRLKELAKHKPSNLPVSFLLYARACDIDNETALLLSRIGAYEVFVGVESADNRLLRAANRGQNSMDAMNAVRLLAGYGIKTLVSFQLGLPGENEESCKATIRLARELTETGSVSEVFSSILLPIPGSKSFDNLMQYDEMKKKYGKLDILPLEELRQDFIRQFCLVDYEYLSQVRDEIMTLYPLSSSLGKPRQTTH
ncbi:MAG: radical SAM protein, partial [Nitrospirota bacterium]|nr:radical SAM protein [Nitrospirota bacterium]